jgi:membrane protein
VRCSGKGCDRDFARHEESVLPRRTSTTRRPARKGSARRGEADGAASAAALPRRKAPATTRTVPATKARLDTSGGWRVAALQFWRADPLTLAASIAFYAALSFAPMVLLALGAMGWLSPGKEEFLVRQVAAVFGVQVGSVVQVVVDNADGSPLRWSVGGMVALGALVVSATSAFAQLQDALNRVWGIELAREHVLRVWLRQRLFSLGILAVLGFLLVTALVVSSVLAALLAREGALWAIGNEIATLVVLALAFAALYRFVPDEVPPWRGALAGGALTALLFEGGKWALGAYLASTTADDAYGGASSLILLLLWVYYSSLIVLLGAGATRWLATRLRWTLARRR